MKLSVANTALAILSGIKINKIADKKVKSALMGDYLALRRAVRPANDEKNEIANKFQSDWRDEFVEVETLRRDRKPIIGHREFLVAEADANKDIFALFEKEVDVETQSVSLDAFQTACKGDDFTLEQIAILEEGGIISV